MAALAVVFGVLSLTAGVQVLFWPAAAGAARGIVLAPVLWFNFVMGAVYIAAGAGIWRSAHWSLAAAWTIAAANTAVGGGVYVYWLLGNAVEPRTLGAVVLRAAVWWIIAFLLGRQRAG